MKHCYHIYTIENVCTGQVYVGKTSQPIGQRERQHFLGQDHSPIDDAIAKGNHEDFTVQTVRICKDREELDRAEAEVMSDFRKRGIKLFNVFYGRGHFQVIRRKKDVKYIYPNLTQAAYMLGISTSKIRAACNSHRKIEGWEYRWADERGKAIEDFVRKYIKPVRKSVRQHTKIWCEETGVVYRSQAEAARAVGVNPKTICKVLLGLRKTAGGYHWLRVKGEHKK